jgi:hypothetical protein
MYTRGSIAKGAVSAFILALVTPSHTQKLAPTTNFTAWKLPNAYPNEQTSNVSRYLEDARTLSSPNFRHIFQNRCITQQVYPYLASGATEPGWVEPYPAFDGVYFVGSPWVSAWVIDSGDGLILIDALDNADEARELIVGGIQKFGFEGSDIKAAIITHEHADHYGGARWLQETFDTPVYMSEVAWDGLATDPANPGGLIAPPVRNLTLEDGVGVTVGNVTVIPVTTPGHTAGTVSLLFPVYENGVKHGMSTTLFPPDLSDLTDTRCRSGRTVRREWNSIERDCERPASPVVQQIRRRSRQTRRRRSTGQPHQSRRCSVQPRDLEKASKLDLRPD